MRVVAIDQESTKMGQNDKFSVFVRCNWSYSLQELAVSDISDAWEMKSTSSFPGRHFTAIKVVKEQFTTFRFPWGKVTKYGFRKVYTTEANEQGVKRSVDGPSSARRNCFAWQILRLDPQRPLEEYNLNERSRVDRPKRSTPCSLASVV